MDKEIQLIKLHQLAIGKNYNQLLKELRLFIYKLVNKYNAGNEHEKDLLQCGRIGLFKAMETYNPEKSTNFFNHAHTYIKREILMYLAHKVRTVRLPIYQQSENHKQHRKDFPTDISTFSLSLPAYEDSNDTLADLLESDYSEPVELDDQEHFKLSVLKPYISLIKPNYQKVINMRYFEEKTLAVVGSEMGISKEAVRQLEIKAIKQLQKLYKI